jgi:hypothetical protein
VSLQDIVDDLAERTGRGIDVEDRRFRLLAYSAHTGALDDVRRDTILRRAASPEVAAWLTAEGVHRADGALRIAPNPDVGGWARACVPVREGGVLLGFVWVLDDPPLSEEDLRAITDALPVLAPALARRRREEDAGREAEAGAVAELLAPAAPEAVRAAAAARLHELGALPEGPVVAAVLLPAAGSEDVLDAVRRRLPARRAVVWSPGGALLAAQVAPAALRPLLAAELARDPGDARTAGVGHAAPGLADAPASHRRAALAAWTAARPGLRLGGGRTALHADLGGLALPAAAARDLPHVDDLEPAGLARLRAAPDGSELAATLLAFLDAGGDAARAAAALHVHRATLYRRLRRAEDLAGVDLADGRARLELHNGLLLARLRS